jgi:hypothetical protein
MHYARWYPTLAEMGNGMVMTMSGLNGQGQVTVNSEMFNPATRTWAKGPVHGFPTYPATFLTQDGRLFFTGSSAGYGPATPAWRTPGFWNTKTDGFQPVPGIADPRTWRPAPRSCCRRRRSSRSWSSAAASASPTPRRPTRG